MANAKAFDADAMANTKEFHDAVEGTKFDGQLEQFGWCPTPPILAALVEAASRTDLMRLFPFKSIYMLRFATSPLWYEGEGEVAPAYIELMPRPVRYLVYSGNPLGIAELVLETGDPAAAAARAEELLASWPPASEDQ